MGVAAAGQAVTQTVVGMADAATHIEDVARSEAAKNKEAMRGQDNEFNIRKNFLDNAVNAIQQATYSQFNIVICTDQEKDDFQNLQGRILPMNLLNLEISEGKFVNFQVYVFDTGNYLRHGKYERDYWWYYGNSKQWYDPAAMHVDFSNAQKKLDAGAIAAAKKTEDDKKAVEDKTAADAKTAAAATANTASDNEAKTLKTEADKKTADAAAQAQGQGNPEVGADPGITPYNGGGAAVGGANPLGGMGGVMDGGGAAGADPEAAGGECCQSRDPLVRLTE